MRKLLLFLFPFFLLASEIETVSIPHPENGEKNIEFFLVRPQGDGPFPIIYLLHGYQYPENATGGKQLLDYGYHKFFIGNGTIVCSISTPGFGHSDGELDFCGPYSQKAVLGVIEYCKALDAVDSSRMGLYGISRGAILGSMVSTLTEDLSLQILEAGRYNAFDTFTALPSYLKGIRENLVAEGGSDEAALLARSAIFHTDKIKAKTLILHGEFDDRMGLDSARTLHHNLIERGICSELV
ncbi:MAG: prolyl oligopeptidase family serine peptidase, partial [Chlamydiia bacterium]|nr:prolyl oligopeptidase family serine peptidase [Chlamydiia bacterium]